MQAEFTFDEMVYNSIVKGKQIYYQEAGASPELKTIDYVKIKKDTRQIQIHCDCGDVFLANQDEIFTFEVQTERPHKKPNRKKIKKLE